MTQVDATLLIVGDGPRREALEERVDDRGIQDRVRFLGQLAEPELHDCYAIADVFALPSVEPSEAFGIVQIEAMAHGTPVVNTDLPTGVPWVSQDGVTGLTVPPRDAGSLADALTGLIDDPTTREKYGRNARERVEEMFSRGHVLSKMDELYHSMVTE
jgi:rhamnosyl/mannosyltransferase